MTVESGGRSYGLGAVIPAVYSEESSRLVRRTDEAGSEEFDAVRDSGPIGVHLTLDFSVRSGLWSLPEQTLRLKLCSNRGEEQTLEVRTPEGWTEAMSGAEAYGLSPLEFGVELPADRRWLRAELWGTVRGAYVRIAFTNVIYFDAADSEGENRL